MSTVTLTDIPGLGYTEFVYLPPSRDYVANSGQKADIQRESIDAHFVPTPGIRPRLSEEHTATAETESGNDRSAWTAVDRLNPASA
jgi:hypothetical protein